MMGVNCPKCKGETGQPCETCGGTGLYPLTSCPKLLPDVDHWEAVDLSESAALGKWPVDPAGILDQSASFVEAHKLIQQINFKLLHPPKNAR